MTSKWEVHLILKPKIHLIVHWYLPKIQEEAYKGKPPIQHSHFFTTVTLIAILENQ